MRRASTNALPDLQFVLDSSFDVVAFFNPYYIMNNTNQYYLCIKVTCFSRAQPFLVIQTMNQLKEWRRGFLLFNATLNMFLISQRLYPARVRSDLPRALSILDVGLADHSSFFQRGADLPCHCDQGFPPWSF